MSATFTSSLAHRPGQVLRAVINASALGDNTVVAGVAGKSIYVIQYTFICSADVTVTWKSAATAISGPMTYPAKGGIAHPEVPSGTLATGVGEALVMNLAGAISVGGHAAYVLG